MSPPRLVLVASSTVGEAVDALTEARVPGAPVATERDGFCGRVTAAELADLSEEAVDEPVGRYADRREQAVEVSDTLDEVAERLSTSGTSWLPVLAGEAVVGIVGMTELVGGYRRALATSLRRLTATGKTVLVEERVADGAEVAGRTIAEVPCSPGTVVLSVQRGEALLLVEGDTRLEPGDLVTALTHPQSEEALRSRVGGDERGEEPTPDPAGLV